VSIATVVTTSAPFDAKLAALQVLYQHPHLICPTGDAGELLSIPRAKNICLPFFGNLWFVIAIPSHCEGRIAIVTNAGRAVVDATLSCAHVIAGRAKLVSGCGARDERRCCGRRNRVVLAPHGRRQGSFGSRGAQPGCEARIARTDGVNNTNGPREERV